MKLEVKNLHKTFDKNEVLHDISFDVEKGKALGLLGRNGAGKTTTIRIIMDLFEASSGHIYYNDQKFKPKDYRIGYLPEERGLYPKNKVMEQLIYLGRLRGLDKKEAKESTLYWLDRLEVDEYKDRKLETLSKGNQQKVQLAQTFLGNPDIIILDEPFSGLDPVNSQILKDIILEFIDNKLLIFSSHQMNYIEEFCEEIALIDKGNLVLRGNLGQIKREYGRRRFSIELKDKSAMETDLIINENFKYLIASTEIRRNNYIIELNENANSNELLKELINMNLIVEKYSSYEPSLQDIFIHRVGEKEWKNF